MRFPTRSAAGLSALLAAVLAAPVAAAQPVAAQLVVQGASFEGAADQSGGLTFLYVASPAIDAVAPCLHAEGRHIKAQQFENSGFQVQTADSGGQTADTLRMLNPVTGNPNTTLDVDGARLDLARLVGSYELHLFTPEGVSLAGHFDGGRQKVLHRAAISRAGLDEQKDSGVPALPNPPGMAKESGFWSEFPANASHVLTEADSATFHLSGTFVLEILGLDLRLEGEGRAADLHSGTAHDEVGVGAVDSHARAVHQSFLRIVVTDGTLDLGVPAAYRLQWSGLAAETTSGPVRMEDATGSVLLSDGNQQRLTGASYRLDGRYDVQANPSQQGLQMAFTGLDAAGQPLSPLTATVRPAASPFYWAAAAAVAGSAAVTLLILGLRRGNPTMADVESSLEAGHFRRAARDAGRLLRRRPGFEDAVLSRAIALAKLGRNRRVVREIQAHFASREPSDGVLHYVLGLALKETGATADAQEAWREALRRTPGLLPQVQPLLSAQQGSSPVSAVGPAVDGTAYA
jgi:hypothetical protein